MPLFHHFSLLPPKPIKLLPKVHDAKTFKITNMFITKKKEKRLICWIRKQSWTVDPKTFLRSFVANLDLGDDGGELKGMVKVTEFRPLQGGKEVFLNNHKIVMLGSDVNAIINGQEVRINRRSQIVFKTTTTNEIVTSKSCVDNVNGHPRLRGVRYTVVFL